MLINPATFLSTDVNISWFKVREYVHCKCNEVHENEFPILHCEDGGSWYLRNVANCVTSRPQSSPHGHTKLKYHNQNQSTNLDKTSWCWIKTSHERRPATLLQATALHRPALCNSVILQFPRSHCLVSPHQQSVQSTRCPTLLNTTRWHSNVRVLGQTQKKKLRHTLGECPDSRKNPTAYLASTVDMSTGQKISLHPTYLGFSTDSSH
jgi:hypothetical protein